MSNINNDIEEIIASSLRPLSRDEIMARYAGNISARTLIRRLNDLINSGKIVAEGKARARVYRAVASTTMTVGLAFGDAIPVSEDARDIITYVSAPLEKRRPTAYERDFVDAYVPNTTWYLNATTRTHLARLGNTGQLHRPAGTHGRTILSRLLIDLSWASSHLEGNTYTRLDTRALIEHGRTAIGKDAIETQMILNHKTAIELLVDDIDNADFNMMTLCNLHGALSENLMPDPNASGRLRRRPVDITGSVFRPLAVPQMIEEMLRQVLSKATQIQDPFEQALFVMVHLPYLQPFEDINKRVSRLAANISLLKRNYCPLTFLGVPEHEYVLATLGINEMNRVELLRDLFVWAYERSAQEYIAVQKSLAEPDPFRLRYREKIHAMVAYIVRNAIVKTLPVIKEFAQQELPPDDQVQFIEVVLDELKRLHEGVLARYRILPSEFAQWKEARR